MLSDILLTAHLHLQEALAAFTDPGVDLRAQHASVGHKAVTGYKKAVSADKQ